ncbi:MAG: R3H domain-containing nucleic acid-binding protein [Myxococcota bacterium]|nr:R3H domain-containing nucleic acid-binding protein [Myxococcota bacterium]
MYDKQNEAREFFADSRDEAVAEAARFFEMEESELRLSEFDPLAVHGLGGRIVVVAAPSGAPRVTPGGGDGDRGGRRERGGRDRERGGRDRERGGRDRERGGRDREPSGRGRGRDDDVRRPERLVAAEDSNGTAQGELGEIGQFLLGVVERMGLGPFEIGESSDGDFLVVRLDGDAAAALAAGDGRGIDALQLLANQASMRNDADAQRVIVDVQGSSEKREQFLTRLAERAARRSVDSKRSVALDPMNPKDRRIIHMALRDSDEVATMSTGSGGYRQVVVVPSGSPEFDDAQRASQEASQRD